MVKRIAYSCSSPAIQEVQKTFSELKDSRNSLKQVKTFEASQNVLAALQEGLDNGNPRAFSRNRTFVGFNVFLRMGFHTMKQSILRRGWVGVRVEHCYNLWAPPGGGGWQQLEPHVQRFWFNPTLT